MMNKRTHIDFLVTHAIDVYSIGTARDVINELQDADADSNRAAIEFLEQNEKEVEEYGEDLVTHLMDREGLRIRERVFPLSKIALNKRLAAYIMERECQNGYQYWLNFESDEEILRDYELHASHAHS